MDSNLLYFWIEAVIAFFLGFLMLLNHLKYKKNYNEQVFSILAIIFFIFFAKSISYIIMNFTDILWETKGNPPRTGIFEELKSLYNYKYFIWQIIETIFIVVASYSFLIWRKGVDTVKLGGLKTAMWIQVVVLIGLGVFISVLSLTSSNAIKATAVWDKAKGAKWEVIQGYSKTNANVMIDVKTTEDVNQKMEYIIARTTSMIADPSQKAGGLAVMNEFIKGDAGRMIFVLWKIILLVLAWMSIASIYGYVGNLLQFIDKNKPVLYVFLGIEIFFYLLSILIPFYAMPFWFGAEIAALIMFAVFAFRVHFQFIRDIEDEVDNLERARDIIIGLMRDISLIIGSGEFELETVIKEIVDASCKGTEARAGTILLNDPVTNRLQVKYIYGMYPPTKPFKIVSGMTLTESVVIEKFKSEKIAIGEGLLGQVVEKGEAMYIPDVMKDERFIQTIKDHMTVTSFMAVPLKTKDEVFGVLSIVDDAKLFLESDLNLLETLGEQAAITIKQIQMYSEILEKKQAEKEISVAGEIQSSLIPQTFPENSKYDIFAFSIPAKGVGGDYYDYIDFGMNKIAVTMFDVSGKGVPAALIMVMIRSILRTIASLEEETRDLLTKMNNIISEEIVEDRYATGFYLLFDAERGIMSYTNAGHGPLLVYRSKQDKFEFLDTAGMPVGIMSGVEYGQEYTTLERGDIAVLYTDGITEAMNLTHEEFGMDRTQEVIRNNKSGTARDIANRILENVNRFVGTAPQHDDETLLILKMK